MQNTSIEQNAVNNLQNIYILIYRNILLQII